MTTYTIEDYVAIAEKALLEDGGVDNWDWYGEALEDYTSQEDEAADAHEFLRCLENSGVDNWEWYGESLSDLDDYETYVTAMFAHNRQSEISNIYAWKTSEAQAAESEVTPEPTALVEEVPEVFEFKDTAERNLFEALKVRLPELTESEVEKIVENWRSTGFWKRNAFPKLMTKAFESVEPQTDGTYLEKVRERYVELVVASRGFSKFLKDFMATWEVV